MFRLPLILGFGVSTGYLPCQEGTLSPIVPLDSLWFVSHYEMLSTDCSQTQDFGKVEIMYWWYWKTYCVAGGCVFCPSVHRLWFLSLGGTSILSLIASHGTCGVLPSSLACKCTHSVSWILKNFCFEVQMVIIHLSFLAGCLCCTVAFLKNTFLAFLTCRY